MKIPDDIFLNRCRWCFHHVPGSENNEINEARLCRPNNGAPCKIMAVANYSRTPGECMSFFPNSIYGICWTCRHNNAFVDGYCTSLQQPNKRQVFRGSDFSGSSSQPNYWDTHILSTCDNYKPDPRDYDFLRRDAAEGRAPRNFDPDTMQPIKENDPPGITAAFDQIKRQLLEEREKIRRQAADPDGEQLTIGNI